MDGNRTIPYAIFATLKCFCTSIWRWLRAGASIVSYHEYWRRRIICRRCNSNWPRCPVCGCFLAGYCRMSTSDCKHWHQDTHKEGDHLLIEGETWALWPTKE